MMVEANQEVVVAPEGNEGEGGQENSVVTLKKEEYAKLTETIGSMKRELKDLKKAKEETKETPKETKSDDVGLLQKGYLRMSGITAEDEVELALSTAKKWGMEVDKIVDDEDFQVKLKRMRDTKSNTEATSNVRGGSGTSQAKNTPEFWKAKGTPPTPTEVPDTKLRRKIISEMMQSASNKGTSFYNE